jgi:hypothetical protein
MIVNLRRLLVAHAFDWEQGVIVVPAGKDSQNVLLPHDSKVLDRDFDLELQDKTSGTPIFTAEDPSAVYFLCHVPQQKLALFQKIPLEYLEGVQLGSVKGYPYGPRNHGIELQFENPLELFITQMDHSPAFAGCPEIHHYCIAEDRKDVLDTFTMRILVGYMNCTRAKDGVKEGYVKVLQRLFAELKPKEQVLPPLEKAN